MSTTLARKIRRIGLERQATTQVVIVLDEQGNETEATHTTYNTRRRYMSEAEFSQKKAEVVSAWRERRRKSRA